MDARDFEPPRARKVAMLLILGGWRVSTPFCECGCTWDHDSLRVGAVCRRIKPGAVELGAVAEETPEAPDPFACADIINANLYALGTACC